MDCGRLLFASIHSYLDPSSGAALATRKLLELMAAHGWDCRALTCGVLDYERETPLDDVLAAVDRATPRVGAALSRGGEAEVFDLELDGVRVTLLPTSCSRAERAPNPREGVIFLDLVDQVLEKFRPDVLLTYGGNPVSLDLMRLARAKRVPVVFHLHNFSYNDRRGFTDVSAVLFPSGYSQRFYRRRIGLDGTAIPYPVRLDRVVADDPEPRFVTFINPQADKGMTVFARMALELGRRRPEVPLLLVEGRGTSEALARLELDLSGLTNLNRMANTPDPRFLPGEPGGADAVVVARVAGPGGGGSDGQWNPGAGQRPGRACPKRWVMPGLSSTSPTGSLPRTAPCQPRGESPRGWPRSNAFGTIRRSKPGIVPWQRTKRGGGTATGLPTNMRHSFARWARVVSSQWPRCVPSVSRERALGERKELGYPGSGRPILTRHVSEERRPWPVHLLCPIKPLVRTSGLILPVSSTPLSLGNFRPAGHLSRRHEKVAVVTLDAIIQPAVSS